MTRHPLARRPIRSRDSRWARYVASRLAQWGIAPNQISVASVLFAALAGAAMFESRDRPDAVRDALLVAGALGIGLRAASNMFDGMVAIEHGKKTASGEIFNELPDRIADALLLVSAGYAIPDAPWAPMLGWSAALLAVLTAYVRSLGAAVGAGQDFSGPMAKHRRLAVLALGCLLSSVEGLVAPRGTALVAALVVIAAGSLATVVFRTRRLVKVLESA